MKIDIFNFIAYNQENLDLELNITSNTQSSSILKLKNIKFYTLILSQKKITVKTQKDKQYF